MRLPLSDGRPVDGESAFQAVQGWLHEGRRPFALRNVYQPASVRTTYSADRRPLFHVVALKPFGFVVTAPDDRIEPIVAFVPRGSFEPESEGPLPALLERDLRGRLAVIRQLERCATVGVETVTQLATVKWNRLLSAASVRGIGIDTVSDLRVEPLLRTAWGQSVIGPGPEVCYNYYTPPGAPGESGNYPTGCVATAMAQVMHYFQHPVVGVGTARFEIHVDGNAEQRALRGGDGQGGPYDWNLMPLDPYRGGPVTEAQKQAVAALCHDAGVAAHGNYTPAYTRIKDDEPAAALTGVFHYQNAVRAHNNLEQIPMPSLLDMVNANLDSARPVIVGLQEAGETLGHVVVADGYGYDLGALYHHLNMGWQGEHTAWYNLPEVILDEEQQGFDKYDLVDFCVYNIFPAGQGEIVSGRVLAPDGTPMAGVPVQAATAARQTCHAVTNDRGIYAISHIPSDTNVTLQAVVPGHRVSPRPLPVTRSLQDFSQTGNRWGINLVALPSDPDPVISGYVRDFRGHGVDGVSVAFGTARTVVKTDASGFYAHHVAPGWGGQVEYLKAGWNVSPASRTYADVRLNRLEEHVVAGRVWHVDAAAGPGGDGMSWAEAMPTVTEALDAAAGGDEIWVATGTYFPGANRTDSFRLKENVTVFGGFSGTESRRDERDWEVHATVLSGDIGAPGDSSDNAYHVVIGAEEATLDGFTVRGGHADGTGIDVFGAGMVISSGYSRVANCLFMANEAKSHGGGLFVNHSDALVYATRFESNTALQGGGGMYSNAGDPEVTDCTFSRNTAKVAGAFGTTDGAAVVRSCSFTENEAHQHAGGVFVDGGAPAYNDCRFVDNTAPTAAAAGITLAQEASFTGCFFRDNTADNHVDDDSDYGGGVYANEADVSLVNCVFHGNEAADHGGAVFSYDGALDVVNCTIAGNHGGETSGGVAVVQGTATIANTVLWGNTSGLQLPEVLNNNATVSFSHCDIAGCGGSGAGWDGSLGKDDGGNLDNDPLFARPDDPDGADDEWGSEDDGLRLGGGSPCVDSGIAHDVPDADATGKLRPLGSGYDIGAYERGNVPGAPVVSADSPTDDPRPAWSWTSGGGGDGTCRVQLDGEEGSWTVVAGTTYTPSGDLSEGIHTLYVQEQSASGNWSRSGSAAATVDLTPPAVVGIADDPGPVRSKTWVWEAPPDGVLFRYAVDQDPNGLPGGYTLLNTAELSGVGGTWYLHVQARDEAGNESNIVTVSVEMIAGELVAVLNDVPPALTRQTDTTFTVSGEEVVRYRYRLDAGAWSAGHDVDDALQLTSLGDGSHTLEVVGGDAAGTWQPEDEATSYTWTVDTTPPAAPRVHVPAVWHDPFPAWTWTSGGGGNGTFRFQLDAGTRTWQETTETSYRPVDPLGIGVHTLDVQERDAAGNWSATGSATVQVEMEPASPPVVEVTSASMSDLRPEWHWQSGGGGNGLFRWHFVEGDGAWTETADVRLLTESPLEAGWHTLEVEEQNAAGVWSDPGREAVIVFEVTLYPGWNLVSVPAVSGEVGVNEFLPAVDIYEPCWLWASGEYARVVVLEPCTAFWVYWAGDPGRVLRRIGVAPETAGVQLAAGWNLCGPVTARPVPAAPELSGATWFWNAVLQIYRCLEQESMQPGEGYWLHADEACTVNLGPGP